MKKRVGMFSFTCCEGCIIVFLEVLNKKYDEYMKKIKFENFRALKTNKKINNLDIAFIEGAISTESEIKKLKEIREKSKVLIAMGSGAVNGYPSNQRNNFSEKKKEAIRHLIEKMHQIKKIEPINKFVKVDDNISGCPVEEELLMEKIESYLN